MATERASRWASYGKAQVPCTTRDVGSRSFSVLDQGPCRLVSGAVPSKRGRPSRGRCEPEDEMGSKYSSTCVRDGKRSSANLVRCSCRCDVCLPHRPQTAGPMDPLHHSTSRLPPHPGRTHPGSARTRVHPTISTRFIFAFSSI